MEIFGEKKNLNKMMWAVSKVCSIPGVRYFSELLGPYELMCEILCPLTTSLLEQMTWVEDEWQPCGYHCSASSKILLTRGSELSKLGKCHTRGWRNGCRAIGET